MNARPTDLGLADIAGRAVPVDAVDTAPIPVIRIPVAVPAQVMPGPGAGRRVLAAALSGMPLAAVLAVAAFLRFWQLAAVGFNGDEAVYTGTAASIAGDHSLSPMFPVFRAHPLLFQTLLSLVLRIHETDWTARAFPAAIGVATVAVTYLLASRLYGRKAGLIAGLLLAVMPYHVVVSRQVLLDGLMTLMATGALYCVVRYLETVALRWLLAAGSVMGLAILSKETSVILLGGLYAFFALTPSARMRARHIFLALLVVVAEAAVGSAPCGCRDSPTKGRATCSGRCSGRPITAPGSTSPCCRHGSAGRYSRPRWPAWSGCAARRPGGNACCWPG